MLSVLIRTLTIFKVTNMFYYFFPFNFVVCINKITNSIKNVSRLHALKKDVYYMSF